MGLQQAMRSYGTVSYTHLDVYKRQVLKVPHHGYEDVRNKDAKGKFSSNHKKFFDKVQPAISIISNGYRNKDRVPSGLITRELAKSNIYTTGDNGNIIVTSNGSRLSVSTVSYTHLATVIAQRPKLAPYIEEMREKIAETLGVGRKQVNVKATTEEHLGFTGEGLGISAQAVCMLTTVDNYIYEDVLRPGAQTGCCLLYTSRCV